ncbi:MAG TPA: anion permease [Limnochordia bacterium]
MTTFGLHGAEAWVLFVITLAFLFDLTNGANNVSGIVASAVTTRALSARGALILGAAVILIVQFIPAVGVARVIGEELVQIGPTAAVDAPVRLFSAALIGAAGWNLFARQAGFPSSTTHALIGGLIGAATAVGGRIEWGWAELWSGGSLRGVTKVVVSLLVSPLLGLVVAYTITALLGWSFSRSTRGVEGWLRRIEVPLTLAQAAMYGLNDAQKSMGIIGATLAWYHGGPFSVPLWVRLFVGLALGIGANIGSRRIVRRVGSQIVRVTPLMAVTSQATSLAAALGATLASLPISSTQVIASSIAGTGIYWRLRGVRYRTVQAIIVTWFVTIPGAIAAGWAAGLLLSRA